LTHTMSDSLRVFAPATVANVSCGYDVLGFAVENPGDEIVLRKNERGKVNIIEITGDDGKLPKDAALNTAGVSIRAFLHAIDKRQGFDIHLHKKMPLGSGLGSSAASAVAGIYAANELMGRPMSSKELLPFAMMGEKAACGSAHADNVAPSMLGGFVLVRTNSPIDVIPLPLKAELFAAIVHPQVEVKTKDAREILKKQIPLKNAVIQWGNIGGLIVGLLQGNYDLMKKSMHDVIIEPIRADLIPGYFEVKEAALKEDAIGAGISGSGPSIFALCRDQDTADRVGEAMRKALVNLNIDNDLFISPINCQGPVILD